jgi:hypothetical protein
MAKKVDSSPIPPVEKPESEPFERDENAEARLLDGWEAYVPDFVKRSLFGREGAHREGGTREGASREAQREEGGRSWLSRELARELANIPREVAKEIARGMLAQADRLKNESSKVVANELRRFLGQLNLWEELRKMMDGTVLDIEMKIRFRAPEGTHLTPTVESFHIERIEEEEEKEEKDSLEKVEPLSSAEKEPEEGAAKQSESEGKAPPAKERAEVSGEASSAQAAVSGKNKSKGAKIDNKNG